MTLDVEEFVRRFLLHVLPAGFHKTRHYGLLAARNRKTKLLALRLRLAPEPQCQFPDYGLVVTEQQTERPCCPACGSNERVKWKHRRPKCSGPTYCAQRRGHRRNGLPCCPTAEKPQSVADDARHGKPLHCPNLAIKTHLRNIIVRKMAEHSFFQSLPIYLPTRKPSTRRTAPIKSPQVSRHSF